MTILIVEDELGVRNTLKRIVAEFQQISTILESDNVIEAVKLIDLHKPDIIFLDINIKDGTSFQIFEHGVNPDNHHIVFITSFEDYAVKAFKLCAIDYVLKPFSEEEIILALKKCTEKENQENITRKIETLIFNTNNKSKKIVLNTAQTIHIIEIDQLVRCEADGNYTHFILKSNEKITTSKKLKDFEPVLESYGFCRCHQSHMVNVNFIKTIQKLMGNYMVLMDGTQVPYSRQRKDELIKMITHYKQSL